jgi:hypothetical protein
MNFLSKVSFHPYREHGLQDMSQAAAVGREWPVVASRLLFVEEGRKDEIVWLAFDSWGMRAESVE